MKNDCLNSLHIEKSVEFVTFCFIHVLFIIELVKTKIIGFTEQTYNVVYIHCTTIHDNFMINVINLKKT